MCIRQALTSLFLILLTNSLWAQPTLTKAVHEPQIGDQVVYTRWDTTGIQPGAPGPNQTWNFTLQPLPISIVDSLVYAAPAGPIDSLFPQADIMALHAVWFDTSPTEVREYLYRGANTLAYEGYHMDFIADGGLVVYTKMASTLAYPFAYGDAVVDSAEGTYFGLWMQQFSGVSHLEADAYGSLTVNGATYNNVLRVHEWDSIPVPGIKYQTETWRYFLPGQRYPALTISCDGERCTPYTTTVLVTDRTPQKEEAGIRIYPQPSCERVFIETMPSFSVQKIRVFDLQGKWVVEKEARGNGSRMEIETKGWIPGLYLLRLEGKGGSQMQAKMWVAD